MKFRFILSLSIFATLVVAPLLRAQLGNNNPTGPAGSFDGNVTTGCSYSVFTGNATRAVTDLVVPGAVGSYPLAFGRTANSRGGGTDYFGSGGGWRHSYSWDLDGSSSSTNQSFAPTYYEVSFPDGRIVTFTHSNQSDPYFRGPPGVRERFQPLNTNTSSLLAYLILPDGGKVEFKATRNLPVCDYELHPPCSYSYSYKAQAIVDPYGARTVLVYNGDGTLNTITEPAGRWIQLIYGNGSQVIDHVTASDGRSVQYSYAAQAFPPGTTVYTYLSNVGYYSDSSLTATYTYAAPNLPGAYNFPPLLLTCDDPMYAGPMKKIRYEYATGTNGNTSAVVLGQIRYEKSIDG